MRGVLLACLVLVLLAPTAHAQPGTAPSVTLTFQQTPTKPVVPEGGAATVSLELQMRASNFACTTTGNFVVALSATSDMPGAANTTGASGASNASVKPTVSPERLTYAISPGAYGSNAMLMPAAPYMRTQTLTVVSTATGLTEAKNSTITVKANLPAYTGTDCRGASGFPAREATTTFVVAYNATDQAPPPEGPRVPFPGAAALAMVLVGVVTLRRLSRP